MSLFALWNIQWGRERKREKIIGLPFILIPPLCLFQFSWWDSDNKKPNCKASEVTKSYFNKSSTAVTLSAAPSLLGFWREALRCTRRKHFIHSMTPAVSSHILATQTVTKKPFNLYQGHFIHYFLRSKIETSILLVAWSASFQNKLQLFHFLKVLDNRLTQ